MIEFERGRQHGLRQAMAAVERLVSDAYSEQSAAQEAYNAVAGDRAEAKLNWCWSLEDTLRCTIENPEFIKAVQP